MQQRCLQPRNIPKQTWQFHDGLETPNTVSRSQNVGRNLNFFVYWSSRPSTVSDTVEIFGSRVDVISLHDPQLMAHNMDAGSFLWHIFQFPLLHCFFRHCISWDLSSPLGLYSPGGSQDEQSHCRYSIPWASSQSPVSPHFDPLLHRGSMWLSVAAWATRGQRQKPRKEQT